MRLALTVSRWSPVRRLLTETALLRLLAGGAGTGLAVWLLNGLATADLPAAAIPVALDLRLHGNCHHVHARSLGRGRPPAGPACAAG